MRRRIVKSFLRHQMGQRRRTGKSSGYRGYRPLRTRKRFQKNYARSRGMVGK